MSIIFVVILAITLTSFSDVVSALLMTGLRISSATETNLKAKLMVPTSLMTMFLSTDEIPAISSSPESFSENQIKIEKQPVKINDSSSTSNNGGAGRRVLRLIDKVNGRLVEKDFAGPIWDAIRYEASAISEGDLKAATLMSNFILSQPSLDEAVMEFVANQLEQPLFQATQIRNLFAEICAKNPQLASYWALDLMASAMRDNSQPNVVSVLLFNKGFHSLVTYRIANALWHEGRDGLAIYFQSLSSRTFGSDIHPACKIGHGCSLSSGTGVVIGETAVIGNDCYISHDVTLGGNGKDKGDRHPKVGNGVYLAAGATILGNIPVGDGSVVNAGSVVTKAVASYTRVGGVPAKLIAKFAVNETYIAEIAQSNYQEEETTSSFDFPKAFINYHKEVS